MCVCSICYMYRDNASIRILYILIYIFKNITSWAYRWFHTPLTELNLAYFLDGMNPQPPFELSLWTYQSPVAISAESSFFAYTIVNPVTFPVHQAVVYQPWTETHENVHYVSRSWLFCAIQSWRFPNPLVDLNFHTVVMTFCFFVAIHNRLISIFQHHGFTGIFPWTFHRLSKHHQPGVAGSSSDYTSALGRKTRFWTKMVSQCDHSVLGDSNFSMVNPLACSTLVILVIELSLWYMMLVKNQGL